LLKPEHVPPLPLHFFTLYLFTYNTFLQLLSLESFPPLSLNNPYNYTTAIMDELTWTQKINKLGDGIDTATATKEDFGEYVETKVYVHKLEGFSDFTLWSLYKEEFEGWTRDNFKVLRRDTRAMLRLHLIERGVYVAPYSTRYPMSDALFNTLGEEEQHEWTDEELIEALRHINRMISTTLRNRLNPNMTDLAVTTQPLA
jgi:hypothetical protein